jgi:hypothetical protein
MNTFVQYHHGIEALHITTLSLSILPVKMRSMGWKLVGFCVSLISAQSRDFPLCPHPLV